MALQPRDRAKAKHGMSTSRREIPRMVVRGNKWIRPTIASTHGPGGETALLRTDYGRCSRHCTNLWCSCRF